MRRNVSRTIDLDLLYFGDCTINDAELRIAASAFAYAAICPRAAGRYPAGSRFCPAKRKPSALCSRISRDNSAVVRVADEW